MAKISDNKDIILQKSNIGTWVIEMNSGEKNRMYGDEAMHSILGVSENSTPEEMYDFWWDRVQKDYVETVNTGVEKMVKGNHAEIRYPWRHPEKGITYVRCGGVRDYSYEKGVRIQGVHQDVSALRSYDKDKLTNLYNKEYFYQRVQEILDENPDKNYKILVSDIEHFKVLNDKYGEDKCDELLKYLADCERSILRDTYIIAARIDSDVFACLQEAKVQTREEGKKLAEIVYKNSPIPSFVWKHGIYYTELERDISVQTMVDRARIAVETVKGVYDVDAAVYTEAIKDKVEKEEQILSEMEEALEEHQFKVYLQPKHDIKNNVTGGAEALIRWIHPQMGFISPGLFVPIFEKNGFIKQVDTFIYEEVCKIIRRWIDEGRKVVPISVNLSRRDFEKDNLVEEIIGTIDKYRVPHEYIHLEITESLFSDSPMRIENMVKQLRENGIQIELDDFGSGYSSLKTLTELELDVLKLDMSIVQQADANQERSILNFCSQLSKMMNLKSVAEGVETEEQLQVVSRLGCDYIQGYYYSRPLSVIDFEEYLDAH